MRNQVEPKPKVGQANSATRLPTITNNAMCKHCGETGHYSAKWANCTEHAENPSMSSAIKMPDHYPKKLFAVDGDSRSHIHEFESWVDDKDYHPSQKLALLRLFRCGVTQQM
jgi:hypothetical protein